jgi:hypothetical protein
MTPSVETTGGPRYNRSRSRSGTLRGRICRHERLGGLLKFYERKGRVKPAWIEWWDSTGYFSGANLAGAVMLAAVPGISVSYTFLRRVGPRRWCRRASPPSAAQTPNQVHNSSREQRDPTTHPEHPPLVDGKATQRPFRSQT